MASSIGPQAGSCGTAAFRRKPVFVTDIETDPLWEPYRDLARSYGLRACWSFPILATDGQVLGTAAVYYRQPRTADPTIVELVSRVAHVAAIAIERRRIDERALALSERTEAIREDERTSISRELHDELGQSLTALRLDISWVARRARDPEMIRKLEEMKRAADGIIQSVWAHLGRAAPRRPRSARTRSGDQVAEPGVHQADRDRVRAARPAR